MTTVMIPVFQAGVNRTVASHCYKKACPASLAPLPGCSIPGASRLAGQIEDHANKGGNHGSTNT